MSKSRWGVLGLAAVLSLVAGALEAQPATEVSDRVPQPAALKGEFYVGPHVGLTFFGHKDVFCRCDVDGNDFVFLGGRMGYMITNNLAVEATGQFTRPDRVPSYWEFTGGALWDFTPRNPGWNTYVAAGGGASRPRPYFRGKGVAIAYLAFGSEYRFNKLIGMRLEMKGQYNFRATLSDEFGPFEQAGRLDLQPNIGVLFRFGGSAQPVVITPAPAPAPVPPPPPAPPEAPAAPEKPAPAAPPPVAPPPPPQPTTDTIQFDHGKSRLTNIAKAKLDAVALRLRDNPRGTCEITGYPDETGGVRGESLARQRAENARQYLIERHGIDGSRITTRTDISDRSKRGLAEITVTFRNP
jgi:outer membrane protein OmpA-like peptidoglycan-associated protein